MAAQGKLERAVEFLTTELCSGYPVEVDRIRWHARVERVAPRTLRRAKKLLGVLSEKEGWSGPWSWRFPDDHPALLFPSTNLHADAS